LKFSLGAGADRWLIAVNPNVHAGTFGSWQARGTGTSGHVTIPDASIPAAEFRVMGAGCENVGKSTANPNGGVNCGVGVLTFRGN
jgi:hypothetical protein